MTRTFEHAHLSTDSTKDFRCSNVKPEKNCLFEKSNHCKKKNLKSIRTIDRWRPVRYGVSKSIKTKNKISLIFFVYLLKIIVMD